jgi:neurofibromin 1
MLKQAGSPGMSKHSEVGLAAAVDICRGATFASADEHEEVPLRILAIDIAHEIKVNPDASGNHEIINHIFFL